MASNLESAVSRLSGASLAITGATGFVGRALCQALEEAGAKVIRLVRRTPSDSSEAGWDPRSGLLDPSRLEGVAAVIHLAGDPIAEGRWTPAKKQRIRDSRVDATAALCASLAKLKTPPRAMICASAIGYYGDRPDVPLDETSSLGTGFLPEVCQAWERASDAAKEAGIRVVNLRLGVVLGQGGGALAKMLLPFKLCLGGRLGSGKQYMSWVSLDDVVGAILHCLGNAELSGPVNAVSPAPATNSEFTQALGAALGRPTILPMPAFAARLAFGEMADALLLASARVLPRRLQETGYHFKHPDLRSCLNAVVV